MKKTVLIFSILFLFLLSSCAPKDNKIHISFSTWGSKSEIATINLLIKNFETENPDIKVDLMHIPDNYFQKLHLLVASNLTPDVIFLNNLNAKIYMTSKKLEPLNTYLEQSKTVKQKDFIENSFLPLSEDGEIFAIPRDISNLVIYYNKDLFDKYNVKYPDNDWNMEEFLHTAQKLTLDTDNNGKNDIFGFGFEKKSLFWLPFLWSNGGGILSPSGKVILAEKASKEGLQFYADLRNKYHVSPTIAEQSSLTTAQLFLQKKVAMHICGRWCSMTYKKNADFNWDVVQFPKGTNASVVDLDTSGWAISSAAKNKTAAWRFIEFLSSDKSMEQMTKDGLILPSKKDVANSNIFLNPPPKNSKAFLAAIPTAMPTPVAIRYSEILDVLDENFEGIFNGNASVDDIINNNLTEKLDELTD